MDCSNDYEPVCGTNNITFVNICNLKRESCLQQQLIEPSYDNSCALCQNVVCPNYSVCVKNSNGYGTECICPLDNCEDDSLVVCGSDGETYQSICHLQAHSCQNKIPITLSHEGPCNLSLCKKCAFNSNCSYRNSTIQCTCDHFNCENFPQ
jgi:hypothetical protein